MKRVVIALSGLLIMAAAIGVFAQIEGGKHSSYNERTASENSSAEQNIKKFMRGQLSPKHLARIEARERRQKEYVHYIDSVVLSRNFEFDPYSFQIQPAGMMHQIYNPNFEFRMYDDYFDVNLPYFKGYTPPYYPVVLNYITYDIEDYMAEQTKEGWIITFSSSLYSVNRYKFTFTIYSLSGMVNLDIASSLYNTVSYSGSLRGIN